jgi:hypothetical protein
MAGVSAITAATRGVHRWARASGTALAAVAVVAGGYAGWYRAAYHAWPGQQVPAVHWCGRDYQSFGDPPQTWRQISAAERFPLRPVGWFPPVWPHQELVAAPAPRRHATSPPPVCAMVVYLRSAPGKYTGYTLEGGP